MTPLPRLALFLCTCLAAFAGCGSDPEPAPLPGASGVAAPEDDAVVVTLDLPQEVVQGDWAVARVTVKNVSESPVLLWSLKIKDVRGGMHSWLQHPPAALRLDAGADVYRPNPAPSAGTTDEFCTGFLGAGEIVSVPARFKAINAGPFETTATVGFLAPSPEMLTRTIYAPVGAGAEEVWQHPEPGRARSGRAVNFPRVIVGRSNAPARQASGPGATEVKARPFDLDAAVDKAQAAGFTPRDADFSPGRGAWVFAQGAAAVEVDARGVRTLPGLTFSLFETIELSPEPLGVRFEVIGVAADPSRDAILKDWEQRLPPGPGGTRLATHAQAIDLAGALAEHGATLAAAEPGSGAVLRVVPAR